MEKIVWAILGMSSEAAVVVCAVLLLRFLFRRLPRSYSYVLWFLVLFRLLCPAAVSSGLSLMPGSSWQEEALDAGQVSNGYDTAGLSGQSDFEEIDVSTQIQGGSQQLNGEAHEKRQEFEEYGTQSAAKTMTVRIALWLKRTARTFGVFWKQNGIWVSLVWLAGAVWLMIAYLVQYMNWKETVRGCIGDPLPQSADLAQKKEIMWKKTSQSAYVVESKRIQEPFVCGIFRPVIYLPAGMEEKERSYILCHERMHIRHRDPFVRLLWQAALVIHWFNPLVWLAVSLVQKDMEMFCDESVMKQCGNGARKEYAMTLLLFSVKKSGLPFPVAFGESNTESRIHHILKQKKPTIAVSVLAVAVIALAAVSLLTDPETPGNVPVETVQEEKILEELQDRNEQILTLAQNWAKASSNRDGNELAAMLADQEKMADYRLEDGEYFYGWSSPWPWNDNARITYAYDKDEAVIHYYANTSDPRIWPWREVLTLTQKDGVWMVEDWELDTEPVQSAAEFGERFQYESLGEYGGDSGRGYRFKNTPLDMFYQPEDEEPWAYGLIRNAETDEVLARQWQTPEAGAATHLYLEGGQAVEVQSPWENKVCLRWEFEDGMTDVICLCHPAEYISDGGTKASELWVVENILEESAYWEELEKADSHG